MQAHIPGGGAAVLTQNPLHLLASLDFADEAPLERADTWVELKPEEATQVRVAAESP